MNLFFFIMIALCHSITWGSFKKGNGGNALYCELKNPQWQLLDSFEAEAVLNFKKDTQLTSANFDQVILSRLRKLDSSFANIYQKNLEQFTLQARWLNQTHLGIIDDSFHLILPAGCSLHQAAVQTSSVYIFQNEIWQQLPALEQHALVAHELLYRTLVQVSELKDSRPVRALNGLLTSSEFPLISEYDLQIFLSQHRIRLR